MTHWIHFEKHPELRAACTRRCAADDPLSLPCWQLNEGDEESIDCRYSPCAACVAETGLPEK